MNLMTCIVTWCAIGSSFNVATAVQMSWVWWTCPQWEPSPSHHISI